MKPARRTNGPAASDPAPHLVRELVRRVLQDEQAQERLTRTLRECLDDPKRALALLELLAKLNRELGPQTDTTTPVTITIMTNVDLTTLGPEPAALPPYVAEGED